MPPLAKRAHRLTELDGLRGYAALAVYFSHMLLLSKGPGGLGALEHTPLKILVGGETAVLLFFVLSGFVLALPWMRLDREVRPAAFVARFAFLRVFRIYPAWGFALAAAIAAEHMFNRSGMSGANDIWRQWWDWAPGPVAANEILRQFSLIRPLLGFGHVDPPAWTLAIEIRMSLLMPFVIMALIRWRRSYHTACLIAGATLLAALTPQLFYLPMFTIGAGLARHWDRLRRHGTRARPAILLLLLIAALTAFGNFYFLIPRADQTLVTNMLSAAGAAALIWLVTVMPVLRAALNAAPSQFLGRVSYSFYLLHLPLLMAMTSWLLPVLHDVMAVGVIALIASLIAAWLAYIGIERPALRISHRIASRFWPEQAPLSSTTDFQEKMEKP